ncbi:MULTISPECIES: hypothetical protein [Salinibaculum]|uniref:hypothetical protein n=1 Tax=Salinibaculum TaxID=2732368 RepID=UPI0030CDB59A
MSDLRSRFRLAAAGSTGAALWSALKDLLSQEFDWSVGHLTALVNGCVFAPSLLTFWLVNGVADFSTALALGTVASPGGLQVRLLAYLLAVPVFVAVRAGYYVAHPVHRQAVLSGSCPKSQLLSLDWFTVGILVTGLPLALRDLGLWLAMNAVFVVGIFLVPRVVDERRRALAVKLGAIALGILLFGYVKLGAAAASLGVVPAPAPLLGPVATLSLSQGSLEVLLRTMNSLLLGPPLVAILGYAMNRVMTHPAVTDIPLLHYTLPRRDPWRAVAASASLGTVFYLLFLGAVTGRLVVVP